MLSPDKQKNGDAQTPQQETTKVTSANAQGSNEDDGTPGAKSALTAAQTGKGTAKMAIGKGEKDEKEGARRQKSLERAGNYSNTTKGTPQRGMGGVGTMDTEVPQVKGAVLQGGKGERGKNEKVAQKAAPKTMEEDLSLIHI